MADERMTDRQRSMVYHTVSLILETALFTGDSAMDMTGVIADLLYQFGCAFAGDLSGGSYGTDPDQLFHD